MEAGLELMAADIKWPTYGFTPVNSNGKLADQMANSHGKLEREELRLKESMICISDQVVKGDQLGKGRIGGRFYKGGMG